jgi:osmotically-inducible protein OsmY
MDQDTLSVSVQDGMVTLTGEFPNPDEKERVCAEIRNVPSVRDVQDQTKIRTS